MRPPHDAQGGESASGSTHTGHPPQTDCSHIQGTRDISLILTKQRLNKLGTHWAFILKIFGLTVFILKFYQTHLIGFYLCWKSQGKKKKNLDDMLFLVWKERTSPWRLGIYNYTISRQAVRETSMEQGQYLTALLLQGRMWVALDQYRGGISGTQEKHLHWLLILCGINCSKVLRGAYNI